jgi:hypothetical protein
VSHHVQLSMKNVVAGGGPEEASAFFYLISVEFGYGNINCIAVSVPRPLISKHITSTSLFNDVPDVLARGDRGYFRLPLCRVSVVQFPASAGSRQLSVALVE